MAVKLIDELQKEIKAAGEAVTQEAYEKAYDHVFQILDNLEKLLNDNRYLEGNEITEEDKPYTYVGDDNETTGYDVEVLKEVFDRLDGYDLQIEVTDIPSVFSGVTSGTYQIGVNNFSYNEERAKSYLYSYPYDKIGYVFITKKGAPEVKTFADAAGKSFEGQSGVSVTTAIESWNEKNPDKKIDITYTDADTAITLQHIEDGTTDLAIIDVAMYNAYQKEYNYDVVANQISDEDAKAIADNSYAYYIFPKDQE